MMVNDVSMAKSSS